MWITLSMSTRPRITANRVFVLHARHNFGMHMTISLEHTKYDCSAVATSITLTSNPFRAEVGLVQFDLFRIRQLGLAVLRTPLSRFGDQVALTERVLMAINFDHITGGQSQGKDLQRAAKPGFTDLGNYYSTCCPLLHNIESSAC